ncbi:MAG: hypothetical protein D6702_08855 [Planctomycetota bacterium]|nr:MAG: hypothetical protein D6702_08855 [Planctomycetota bacterium]
MIVACLCFALPALAQEVTVRHPEPGAVADPVAAIRAAFTGRFLGVERKDGREGTGHIVARELPGGFIGRDYWSEGRGRRLYAGHDVLWLGPGGEARHWWFGSRGDYAEAAGSWTPQQLVLTVRDDEGDPLRRYTYRLAPSAGVALAFRNDHAGRRGWEEFMSAEWHRAEVSLPPDFLPRPEQEKAGWRRDLIGSGGKSSDRIAGRRLFGEWLVLDGGGRHAVLSEGWLGRLRLWTWSGEGAGEWEGEREGRLLRFRPVGADSGGNAGWRLRVEPGEDGMGCRWREPDPRDGIHGPNR